MQAYSTLVSSNESSYRQSLPKVRRGLIVRCKTRNHVLSYLVSPDCVDLPEGQQCSTAAQYYSLPVSLRNSGTQRSRRRTIRHVVPADRYHPSIHGKQHGNRPGLESLVSKCRRFLYNYAMSELNRRSTGITRSLPPIVALAALGISVFSGLWFISIGSSLVHPLRGFFALESTLLNS